MKRRYARERKDSGSHFAVFASRPRNRRAIVAIVAIAAIAAIVAIAYVKRGHGSRHPYPGWRKR